MEHIAVFCSASQDIDNIGWETTVKLWFTVVQVRV